MRNVKTPIESAFMMAIDRFAVTFLAAGNERPRRETQRRVTWPVWDIVHPIMLEVTSHAFRRVKRWQ